MPRRRISVLFGLSLIWIFIGYGKLMNLAAETTPPAEQSAYFVSSAGSDANDGLSPDTPWKTLSKVNAASLQPGDSVLFRRGDVWRQMLKPPAGGTAASPITFGAYGTGENPRISGTATALPRLNAIRNSTFDGYSGTPDDGSADLIAHFVTSGGKIEIVTDTPSGSQFAAKLQKVVSKAQLTWWVFLPADSQVTLTWQAKSIDSDGRVAIRHQLDGPDHLYLQNDLQTWSTTAAWDAYPLAGAINGPWTGRSLTFRTDRLPGAYQIYFTTGNSAAGTDTSFVADLALMLDWQPYNTQTYRLSTGYAPRRMIVHNGNAWETALDASEFGRNKDNLLNREWVYDSSSGHLYLRDDSGNGQVPVSAVEISFPQTSSSGECGIFVDIDHVGFDSLAVTGWPFENPGYAATSGIAVTSNATGVSITNCVVAHNFRIGIGASNQGGTFANNVIAYNGGTGLILQNGAEGITVKSNEVMHNGFWGLAGDDGEGIALGVQSAGNLIEWNDIHHNNRHPESWNHGALILYHSRDNIVRFNTVHDNYKAGVVIDGENNQFYYNLVFNSGIGYADTDAWGMCNLQLRNDTATGGGGNQIYNNVFYGGTANVRWMGNIFIKNKCTDTKIQNNVFWGYVNHGYNNVQIRVDSNTEMTGTVISHNLIGPENDGFIYYLGTNYASLTEFQSATGQGGASLKIAAQFSNPAAGNYHPLNTSPLIDAGIDVSLAEDLDGTPVGNPPNVGAFEAAVANSLPQLPAIDDRTVAAEQMLLFYVRAIDGNADRLTYTADVGGGYDLNGLGAEFAEVLFGDLNADTNVDQADLQMLLLAYNSRLGDSRYDPMRDIDSSGTIDYEDYVLLRTLFGSTSENGPHAGRFRWVPGANQVDLSVPLMITATDSHGDSAQASLTLTVTAPLLSPCTTDVNADGSTNFADLTTVRSRRQQDYHNWVVNCWTPQMSCGDVDGNGVVDAGDQQDHSRRTWQAFNQWVRECWQPAR